MTKDAKFYFGNLVSDVIRSAHAAISNDDARYENSLSRAYKTLGYLRGAHRPEAYEEGLLLMRALAHARARGALPAFRAHLSTLAESFAIV